MSAGWYSTYLTNVGPFDIAVTYGISIDYEKLDLYGVCSLLFLEG